MRSAPVRITLLLLVMAVSLSTAGCLTAARVKGIVDESNTAMLGEQLLQEYALPEVPRADGSGNAEAWVDALRAQQEAAIQKIDDFIAAYPDRKATVNALQIRKALLYLAAGQANMARASFAAYDPSVRGSTRDLALFKHYDTLVWWWMTAPITDPSMLNVDAFTERLAGLDQGIDALPVCGIRYYLANLRAHMAMKKAQLQDPEEGQATLVEGLNRYAREFDGNGRKNVAAFFAPTLDTQALKTIPADSLRWYGQVLPLFERYEKTFRRVAGLSDGEVIPWDQSCAWLESLGQ